MTNWDWIKSLTAEEAAQSNILLCPCYYAEGIEQLPCFNLEEEQQRFCTNKEYNKCIEEWLKGERKNG